MCSNCFSTVGPFYLVFQPKTGKALRACGPIQFNEKGDKLVGRAAECAVRRKKLEDEWYGKEDYR